MPLSPPTLPRLHLRLLPRLLPRVFVVATNLALLLGVGAVALDVLDTAAEQPRVEASLALAQVQRDVWEAPDWFPASKADELDVLPRFAHDPAATKGPNVRAGSALIADLDRGEILWSKGADEVRPIASVTKVVAALAMASAEPDLDREHCVDHRMWPHRPGATSRFETGACHDGWSYLGAALVSSDNRGALGLAAVAGLEPADFVRRMWSVSEQLGLTDSSWVDPSGLDDGNLSTARDVLRAIVALAAHPTLSLAASAPSWDIQLRGNNRRLFTTNRLHGRWDVLAAKTGYTDTAAWCFTQVVRTASGRTLATVVLGSPTNGSRFDDTTRMIRWAEGGVDAAFPAPPAKKRTAKAGTKKASSKKSTSKGKKTKARR